MRACAESAQLTWLACEQLGLIDKPVVSGSVVLHDHNGIITGQVLAVGGSRKSAGPELAHLSPSPGSAA